MTARTEVPGHPQEQTGAFFENSLVFDVPNIGGAGGHLASLYDPPGFPCHIPHSSPATHRAAIFITPRSSNAMFQKYNPESFIRRLHQGLALTDSDISIIYLLKPLIFKSDILKGETLSKKQLGGK